MQLSSFIPYGPQNISPLERMEKRASLGICGVIYMALQKGPKLVPSQGLEIKSAICLKDHIFQSGFLH